MSFGKRGKGEGHPARDLLPPVEVVEGAPVAVRTAVTNPGGIDKGFIALAVGVVFVSAGAALAAPSVMDMFGGNVRPIEQVVAGLDRAQAKVALAKEAFPDTEGRAFMASLQQNFPSEHDRLTTMLADEALTGGDRKDLFDAFNDWSVDFIMPNMAAISRTGSEGFDEALGVIDGTIGLLDKTTGCTMPEIMSFASSPEKLTAVRAYGSESYKFGMRSTTTLVKLAAKGRNAPTPDKLNKEDEAALMGLFFGMMADPQVMEIMQASRGPRAAAGPQAMPNVDICKLGYAVTSKLHALPSGTKARLMGMTAQGAKTMDRQTLKDLVSGKAGMNSMMSGGLPAGMLPGGPT